MPSPSSTTRTVRDVTDPDRSMSWKYLRIASTPCRTTSIGGRCNALREAAILQLLRWAIWKGGGWWVASLTWEWE